ncbi:MAG: DUF4249 family protein [Rikenellaceae bacterium]
MVRELRTYLLVAVAQIALITSCSNRIELDMRQITTSATPFIECYCEVGELYNLAATYLSPIDEPQNLDYSYDFEVYINDTEEHRLLQSIFYVDNFIYSHGSSASLPIDFDGLLQLRVVAEDGSIYTAAASVPDPVEIASATFVDHRLVVEFDSSADDLQNYYSLNIRVSNDQGEVISVRTQLYTPEQNQRLTYERVFDDTSICTANISLLRLNRDGYRYIYSLVENEEAIESNLISRTPLNGNIEGAVGVFTAYTRDEIILQME